MMAVVTGGTDCCELLEWDTDFWGFRVARVLGSTLTPKRVSSIDRWSRKRDVRCLCFLADGDDPGTTRVAEDNGFRFVDIRVTLVCKRTSASVRHDAWPTPPVLVRPYRADDIPALRAIARESHRNTRFYYDESFPRHLCDLFYETWVTRSCEGYADAVWVAERDGGPVGYVTCHMDRGAGTGRIGLMGVSGHERGQGIGGSLVLSALQWFWEQGAQEILVVTQGRNCAAQRLYQRCGFVTQDVQIWYHRWYSPPDPSGG